MTSKHVLVALVACCAPGLSQSPGFLDTSFGSGGYAVSSVSGAVYRGLAVQSDGRAVAVGTVSSGSSETSWLVERYLEDGSIDASFGDGGHVTLFAPDTWVGAFDVAIDADGRIVVVGETAGKRIQQMTVVRLDAFGNLDGSFGSGGIANVSFGRKAKSCGGRALALQEADGCIVVAGWVSGKKSMELALARLTESGSADAGFGDGGAVVDILTSGTDWPAPGGIALQGDGKIVLCARAYVGQSGSLDHAWYVIRYEQDGDLDTTFGDAGRVHGQFAGFSYPRVAALAVDTAGHIVVGGRAFADSGTSGFDAFVARYAPDGGLDTTFAGVGYGSSGLSGDDQGYTGLAIQADGRIVQGLGFTAPSTPTVPATLRYLPAGVLDPTYGVGGLSDMPPIGVALDGSTVVDGLGRIVMCASANGTAALVRFVGGT